MDTELRATLDRFERYFELIQQQLSQHEAQFAALREISSSLRTDVGAVRTEMTASRTEMTERFGAMQTEMTERFISVDEQLRTLTMRVQQFEVRAQRDLDAVKGAMTDLSQRMTAVEDSIVELHRRVDTLSDDMRQRFRGVNERLTSIERRSAA
jgi:chromosome segregation ATPase